MTGGFVAADAGPSTLTAPRPTEAETAGVLLTLTPRQEARLRAHLDDRLLGLERDERKAAFVSIPLLLDRLHPLLNLILQIPPRSPFDSLRISYLLALTGPLATYITSLPLLSSTEARQVNAQEKAGRIMSRIIHFLDEVDRGWVAVLKGQAWVMQAWPANASPDVPSIMSSNDNKPSGSREKARMGKAVQVDFGGSVGQTERLRSITISSREKLLAWARTYGAFPGSALPHDDASESIPLPAPTVPPTDDPYDFDPDPPTSYAAGAVPVETDTARQGGDWEDRVLGMWGGTLEVLSRQDFGDDRENL